MNEKLLDYLKDLFAEGMYRYESLCEEYLVQLDLPEEIQNKFQYILDKAQEEFERKYL